MCNKRSQFSSYQKDGEKKNPAKLNGIFFKPELEDQVSAFILLTFNKTNQRQVTSLQQKVFSRGQE